MCLSSPSSSDTLTDIGTNEKDIFKGFRNDNKNGEIVQEFTNEHCVQKLNTSKKEHIQARH